MYVINEKQALKELEKGCKKAVDILKNDERVEDFLRQVEAKLRTIPKIGRGYRSGKRKWLGNPALCPRTHCHR